MAMQSPWGQFLFLLCSWLYYLNSIGYCVVTGLPDVGGVVTEICRRIGNLQKTIYGEVCQL